MLHEYLLGKEGAVIRYAISQYKQAEAAHDKSIIG